jgi:hypothetical protein
LPAIPEEETFSIEVKWRAFTEPGWLVEATPGIEALPSITKEWTAPEAATCETDSLWIDDTKPTCVDDVTPETETLSVSDTERTTPVPETPVRAFW